jgi:hypothetical protein
MNKDYLWDKTGEPDPEIQELEEILGTLRYQPKPLEIPQDIVPRRRQRSYFPVLAIAASILLALLAAGVWLRVRTAHNAEPKTAVVTPVINEKTPEPERVAKNSTTSASEQVRKAGLPSLSRNKYHKQPSALAKQEREEALAAKQQLMIALRLTSEKLNLVHRKMQIPTPSNQIKNQHRVG